MSDDAPRRPTTLRELLARHERLIIVQTIRANGGSRKVAAEVLGVSYPTLMRRMSVLKVTRVDAPVRVKVHSS